jgi:predicted nucleic acid-binding protein
MAAARLKARHTISYADAFAVALAQELGAPVVTGDREFEHVESLVEVLWL